LKELSSSTENTANNNSLYNRNSTVGVEQISEWLDEQKSEVTPIKNSIIDSLKSSSIFEQMWVEELNEEENLIIVPLSSDFQSQHNAQYGPKNYLLFIEDEEGKIRKGNIIQYLPENGNAFPDLPVSSFHDFYNHKDLEADGKYVFLSLADVFQLDFEIDGGKMVQARIIDRNSEGLDPNCTHWYLVTPTFFYEDGQLVNIEYDIEDLGISCSSCPPNQLCDELDGSGVLVGSNGPSLPQTPIETEAVEWVVAAGPGWSVHSFETLKGRPSANYIPAKFTSIIHDNIAVVSSNQTTSGAPFATWNTMQAVPSLIGGGEAARITVRGTITFNDGTSRFERKINSWLAASVFP
jgi:hypothetical protein